MFNYTSGKCLIKLLRLRRVLAYRLRNKFCQIQSVLFLQPIPSFSVRLDKVDAGLELNSSDNNLCVSIKWLFDSSIRLDSHGGIFVWFSNVVWQTVRVN